MITDALTAETIEWRRTHTYGGEMWTELDPKSKRNRNRGAKRSRAEMAAQTEYLLGEVEWFLECDVHPLQICDQLHANPRTIYKLAERHGRTAIQRGFGSYAGSRAA